MQFSQRLVPGLALNHTTPGQVEQNICYLTVPVPEALWHALASEDLISAEAVQLLLKSISA